MKSNKCPYCGGNSEVTLDTKNIIIYRCNECREVWQSYKRKTH